MITLGQGDFLRLTLLFSELIDFYPVNKDDFVATGKNKTSFRHLSEYLSIHTYAYRFYHMRGLVGGRRLGLKN